MIDQCARDCERFVLCGSKRELTSRMKILVHIDCTFCMVKAAMVEAVMKFSVRISDLIKYFLALKLINCSNGDMNRVHIFAI